jgi:polysaccharide biosynthesis/export protein VpsN
MPCRAGHHAGSFNRQSQMGDHMHLRKHLGLRVLIVLPGLAAAGPPASAPQESAKLLLQPGDLIRMEVYGRPEMTTATAVLRDGTARLPLIGAVKIGGLSPTEAAERIEAAYKAGGFLTAPWVLLTLFASQTSAPASADGQPPMYSINGEVRTPATYPLEAGMTVQQTIVVAGGITGKGSLNRLAIRRRNPGGEVTLAARRDDIIQDGEVITVKERKN